MPPTTLYKLQLMYLSPKMCSPAEEPSYLSQFPSVMFSRIRQAKVMIPLKLHIISSYKNI